MIGFNVTSLGGWSVTDLSALEKDWRRGLQGVSFVSQVIDDEGQVADARAQLGRLLRNSRTKDQRRNYYFLYPASFLVVMTDFAGANWGSEGYWGKLFAAMGISHPSQGLSAELGTLFKNALDQFGLDRFSLPLPLLGEILLHATVPANNQKAFINRLAKAYQTDPTLTAEYFSETIRAIPQASVQSSGLGMATWHFFHQAPEFAAYFTQQCIDFLDDVQDGIWDEQGGVGLPPRVLQELKDISARGEILLSGPRVRAQSQKRPTLVYDRESNEVLVELPRLHGFDRVPTPWEISGEEITIREIVPPALGGLRPDRVLVKILRPTSQLLVECELDPSAEAVIRLFDTENYLVVFNSEGRFLLPGERVPQDDCFLLYPRQIERHKVTLVVEGRDNSPHTQELGSPSGWHSTSLGGNWQITRLAFDEKNVAFWLEGGPNVAPRKPLSLARRFAKPQAISIDFETSKVQNVSTSSGLTVLSSWPSILLPAMSTSEDAAWKITVRDDIGSTLHHEELEPASQARVHRLSAPLVAGNFSMQVERRRGRGVRQKFCLAPDLEIEIEPAFRKILPDGSGLEPATVKYSSKNAGPVISTLDSSSTTLELQGPGLTGLVLQTPHLSLLVDAEDKNVRTSRAVRLSNEALHSTRLRFVGNFSARPRLSFINKSDVLQTLWPKIWDSTLATFNLEQASDSVLASGSASVYLKLSDSLPILVGTCAPERLFEDLSLEPEKGEITLACEAIPENLEAAFYSTFGLLPGPLISAVTSHSLDVPPAILNLGPFDVALKVADPWAFEPWDTSFKAGTNSKHFEVALPDNGSPVQAFVAWMTTGERQPNLNDLSQDELWRILITPPNAKSRISYKELFAFAEELLDNDPTAAFDKFPETLEGENTYLRLLFQSDVVDECPAEPVERITTRGVALRMPALYAIACAGRLGSDSRLAGIAQSAWLGNFSEAEDGNRFNTIVLQAMVSQDLACRQSFANSWSFEGAQKILSDSGMVGGPLLSSDNWPFVFLELSQRREEFFQTGDFISFFTSRKMLEFDEEFKLAIHDENLYRLVSDNRPVASVESEQKILGLGKATVNVPAASLRLAILARLAARGNDSADKLWHQKKQHHQVVSRQAPKLAELDLVIAELTLSALSLGD